LSLRDLRLLQQYLPIATDAQQHDRHKKKDRQRGGLSKIQSGVLIKRLR
jgi:hypothetical protein